MNAFERTATDASGLVSADIETVQVNVGFLCNQACAHCHLGASADRTEVMDWVTMERIVSIVRDVTCGLVDITGGAPELNPHLRRGTGLVSKGRVGERVQDQQSYPQIAQIARIEHSTS